MSRQPPALLFAEALRDSLFPGSVSVQVSAAAARLGVMRLSFLASKCPEYRALRAQSQGWAQVWQLGHGFVWMCVLSVPGVIAAWWVLRDDPEPHRNVFWSLVAPVLLVAAIGVALKRYAIRKGRASDATTG